VKEKKKVLKSRRESRREFLGKDLKKGKGNAGPCSKGGSCSETFLRKESVCLIQKKSSATVIGPSSKELNIERGTFILKGTPFSIEKSRTSGGVGNLRLPHREPKIEKRGMLDPCGGAASNTAITGEKK